MWLTASLSEHTVFQVVYPTHALFSSPAHGTVRGPPGEKGERGYPGPKGKACHPFPLKPMMPVTSCCPGSSTGTKGMVGTRLLLRSEPPCSEGGLTIFTSSLICSSLLWPIPITLVDNLFLSFLQVTRGRWAHQDARGTGDQKERKARKVRTSAIPGESWVRAWSVLWTPAHLVGNADTAWTGFLGCFME